MSNRISSTLSADVSIWRRARPQPLTGEKSLRGAFLQNQLILIHDLNNVRKPQTWPIIRGTCYKSRWWRL
ncbi:hypothetical protein GE061_004289 [Apolygus lucorum]|uniref:Uncharacterized protein n=1 Tax=Apolygus lucorum TaxID=248454 RepID=A0A8S9WYY2_APOLU|nr:hypothetical protein GE061_004289 [Apolygus lucorum]